MKALSLIKLMTFVSMIIVTCATAWGQATVAVNPDAYLLGQKEAALNAEKNKCSEALIKVNEANAKANSACKSAGFDQSTCSSSLDDCNQRTEEEIPLSLPGITGTNLFAFSNAEKSCTALTQDEYDTKLDKLERKEEKINDELSRAKKDLERDEKDYQEDSAKLQKEVQDLIDEKSKAELEDKENDRKAEGEEKVALDDLRKEIRKLENEVISAIGRTKDLANLRSRQITGYRKKILLCKLEAEKTAAERKKLPKQSGNLNSATRTGSSNNQVIQEIYQTCVQDVLTERTTDGDTYQTQLTNLNKFIADTETEIKELKASEELALRHSAQAKIDRENNRQERDKSFLQKYQSLLEQKKATDNLMTQRRSRAAQELAQAQQKANKASNDLSSFGLKTPISGTKKVNDIQDAIDNSDAAAVSCRAVCGPIKDDSGKILMGDRRDECDRYKKRKTSSGSVGSSGTN